MNYTARKPSGHFLDSGGNPFADTVSCVHCQKTWEVAPGSGKERGFCMKCMGPVCGRTCAVECNPWEKQMEDIERRERNLLRLRQG